MKNLMLAAGLVLASFPLMADNHIPDPDAICTHTIEYVIYDEHGNKMDLTRYERLWPLDCVTSTRLKYETLKNLTNDGEAQFEALVGGN